MSSRFHLSISLCCAACLTISGCSNAGEFDGSVDAAVPDATDDEAAAQPYLGLVPPKTGFQVRDVGLDIQPGEDVEYCEVARLPGEPDHTYYAKSFEFGNGKFSHHLIVTAATLGGEAEKKLAALGVGNRVECLSAESQFGANGWEGIGGSQQPYRSFELPPGVGNIYHGGQLVVFDYHYFNPSMEVVQARSAVNFHLTDEASIDHIARGFSFRNLMLATAPGTQASYTGECHFKADVRLGELTRHTHQWGKDFTVWFAGGSRDGEKIWSSEDWQHDTSYTFEEPILVRAGEGIRFRCDYQNDSDHVLRYGTSATDEMCILFGTLWEAEIGQELGSQNCQVSWSDANGIGHPADEAGGFPKPTTQESELCRAKGAGNACAQCRCDSCATSAIQCAVDGDCSAMLACYTACPAGTDCGIACQSTVDEHSSGLGVIQQMTACFNSKCGSVCSGQ